MNTSFQLIATGALTSLFLMLRCKNPVHAVFYLVLTFLHCSGLLVFLGLEFFVLLQLLVYVGALAILFLFVVMLLDIQSTEILAHQRGSYPITGVLALCVMGGVLYNLNSLAPLNSLNTSSARNPVMHSGFWTSTRESTTPVVNLGIALYGVHPFLLMVRSFVLLVAMIGAVALTLERPVETPNHDVFRQHAVDFQKVVVQLPKASPDASFFNMMAMTVNYRGSLLEQPVLGVVNNHLVRYPTPSNLNSNYNWGVLRGLCLVLQIATGIFLAMHYTAHVDLAFHSVQHLMRDVPFGWLLRYLHANGASLFFRVVYLHLFRGLYYTSYAQPRELVWILGVVILLIMILTAFIGYVLPWGQMSLWGRTVITSLASALPVVGSSIVAWLWGGFSVDNPTLNRFFSLHYLLPFILAALSLAHLAALHQYGSTNPLGIQRQGDRVDFYPYYYTKDLVAAFRMRLVAAFLVAFRPERLGHPDNNIPANPYSTPAHIVPEWYFLWVYRILRSIPNKLAGVLAILLVFVALLSLPFVHTPGVRGPSFRRLHQTLVWALISDFFLLTYLGQQPVEAPYVFLGQLATVAFFGLLGALCVAALVDDWLRTFSRRLQSSQVRHRQRDSK